MYYVYVLKSLRDNSFYKGVTADLKKRILEHNSGLAKYSSFKKPFKLVWYSAFSNKEKAYKFEKYIKSGSGFAFVNKHLI
ncbi:MAG: GIY-YIG nuclease family protein [bacterium]|nr:GIY-YIG nuclease family protein [bacterium]